MGPRVGVGGYREEKTSRPHRVSNPEPPSPQRIATATTLSPPPDRMHDVTDVVRSSSINLVPDNLLFTVQITAVHKLLMCLSMAARAHVRVNTCFAATHLQDLDDVLTH